MAPKLVLYYSWSGNTRRVAKQIAERTGAQLQEIEPVEPYPAQYAAVVERARREIETKKPVPVVSTGLNLAQYDTIFIGTPNWCSTVSSPVSNYLRRAILAGKKIAPFCTHGGGGAGHVVDDLTALCPECEICPALVIRNDGGDSLAAEVDTWLSQLGEAIG